jgi:DNA (cytosine-5)-methyltransferase 1
MTDTSGQMVRARLLDLFCGDGGAAKGYADAGFDVTGIDTISARLRHYPFDAYQADALECLADRDFTDLFDVIHASPPCTGYTRGTAAIPDRLDRYDRLIPVVRELLEATGKPYVIENVADAKPELRSPLQLCWTEFHTPGSVTDDDGTPLQMFRHRLFESNVPMMGAGGCRHAKDVQVAGAYGGARRNKVEAREVRKGGYVPSLAVMHQLLGTPWMSETGCFLSIPPAYTQFIGEALMDHLTERKKA